MANFPAQPSKKPRFSKTDRWIVNYFSVGAVLFSSTYVVNYVWNSDYGTRVVTMLLAFLALIKALSSPASHGVLRGRMMVFMALMLGVAVINIAVSTDMVETSLRWVFCGSEFS